MTKILKKHKGKTIFFSIFAVVLIIINILVANDYSLYEDPIVKITNVTETESGTETGSDGEIEIYYTQEITGVIKNGDYKGTVVEFENEYSYSQEVNDSYVAGSSVFVNITGDDDDITVTLLSEKMDVYLSVLISFLIFLLVLVAGIRGVTSLVSLAVNAVVVVAAFYLYNNGMDFIKLSIAMLVIFGVSSLILANGFNKQTIVAILASALSVIIVYFLYEIIISNTQGLEYLMQEYVANTDDLAEIFMVGTLIGGFGAILDVAISMTTSVNEIIKEKPDISRTELVHSMREIAYDIMGTMINVLFFTYIAGALPMILLRLANDFSVVILFKLYLTFEMVRFLVGSIGIVITIPISGFIALIVYKKKGVRK